MATIRNRDDARGDGAAYPLVRRAQAAIAGYRHFGDGDLCRYLERDSFRVMATRLTDHFFHRSVGLALYEQVCAIYLCLLVMASILQRLPLSAKFDWHRGHMVSFFRMNAGGRIKRYHVATRTVERSYRPDELRANLGLLGIHDAGMVAVLLDLYRRHAGGLTLKDQLAHQLFDPILMMTSKEGFELRHGNRFHRIEKSPFAGSVDLRREPATVLDYRIMSHEHSGGRHLEIMIADHVLGAFRQNVKGILGSSAPPARKVMLVDGRVRDFVESARWARSAKGQVDELRRWLGDKLRPLSGTMPEVRHVANLLPTLWCQRAEHRLFFKAPNFFLDPKIVDEKTYRTFFSPYREVSP